MSGVCVGDPVDVITGAQFDVALDFQIAAWRFPLEWKRYYSTARARQHLPLGWGHTHSYDHRLRFDSAGLSYRDPSGKQHAFDLASPDQPFCLTPGGSIRRVEPLVYRVKVGGHPECEFHFTDSNTAGQLRKVYRAREFHELRYAADGRWTELIYGSEPPVIVDMDSAGRIRSLVWKGDGKVRQDRLLWQGEYDDEGNLIRVVDAYGTSQTFTYNARRLMIRRTDRKGFGFDSAYDDNGRCVLSTCEDGVQKVEMRYLEQERVTMVTRADGGLWQYFHQREGVTRIVDPYGGVTRRIYADNGELQEEIGPEDEILLKPVPDEGPLRPPFAPAGNVLLIGDPWLAEVLDQRTPSDALDWDGYGARRSRSAIRFPSRQSPWIDEFPPAVARALRYAERPEEETPAPQLSSGVWLAPAPQKPMDDSAEEGPGTRNVDDFGRPISHTLPDGAMCRWQYDPNGNVIRYTDYLGSDWRSEYQSFNLLTGEIDPLQNRINREYNKLEMPVRITDAGGTATEHRFDLKDRMIERLRHGGSRDQLGYDRSAGLRDVSAAGQRQIKLSIGRNPRRPLELEPAGQDVRRCAYDDRGRLTAIAEENGDELAFGYELLGKHTADLRNGRGVTRAYSSMRIAEINVLGRFITRYTFDTRRARLVVVDPMGGTHQLEQLHLGVFVRRQANGVEEVSQFDWNGRCLGKIAIGPGDRAWSRVYRYSAEATLLRAEDSRRGSTTYEYDRAHRLIRATGPGSARADFAYDQAGNLVSAPALRNATISENRLIAANGSALVYNHRHNLIRDSAHDGVREYEYDSEDRLVTCSVNGVPCTFHYDALGRRISKSGLLGVTEYYWDGERLAAEIKPSGGLRVYVYADEAALTPFAFIDYDSADADPASGRRYYVFTDQIACPVAIEDEFGNTVWKADIEPYGRAAIAADSQIEFNLRWPGHYFDPETALHYNRYRYYCPELGRYIQVDPRDLDGGINLYAYTSRPLDTVDVNGLAPCPKKPIVNPANKDKKTVAALKAEADELANNLRAAIKEAVDNGEMHPMNAAGTTLTAMVVKRTDGTYEVVVTGNRSDASLPRSVTDAMGDARYIGYGDDRPPPVRQTNDDHRFPRDNPRTGEREPTTHNHAEQRGLRATDCDDQTAGVAYIAPTRPCCEGCSKAIQDRGGTNRHVSDLGQQPGDHGNWWE